MSCSTAEYWLLNKPTIAELQRLNRESWYEFPLYMLDALIVAGIDLKKFAEATVHQVVITENDIIELRWWVYQDGIAMAELTAVDDHFEDGSIAEKYRVSRKHKSLNSSP